MNIHGNAEAFRDKAEPSVALPPYGTPLTIIERLYLEMAATTGVSARLEDLKPGMIFFAAPTTVAESKLKHVLQNSWMFLELHCPALIKLLQKLLKGLFPRANVTQKISNLVNKKLNGNFLAPLALNMGAASVVLDSRLFQGEKYFHVPDSEKAYHDLAWYLRRQFGDKNYIGITGSCGKTTTKELVATVLSSVFNTVSTHENSNTRRGVCRTIFKVNSRTEAVVIEMGALAYNESIEIKCRVAQPNMGLITNIGQAHLEGFGSVEGVLKIKRQLFDYLLENNGLFFLNMDDKKLLELAQGYPGVWSYGTHPHAQTRGEIIEAQPYLKVRWHLDAYESAVEGSGYLDIQTKLFGAFNVSNVLAAIAVGRFHGIAPAQISRAIENYEPRISRSEIIRRGTTTYILDAYNANPTSMSAALDSFLDLDFPRKAVILGDMKELGKHSEESHIGIVKKLEEHKLNSIVLVGTEFGKVKSSCINQYFENVDELKVWLETQDLDDTWVLIKGSNSINLETIVKTKEIKHQ